MVTVTIKVNKSHKFAINVRGEPPPTLTWFTKDGDEIKPSDKIKVRKGRSRQTGDGFDAENGAMWNASFPGL